MVPVVPCSIMKNHSHVTVRNAPGIDFRNEGLGHHQEGNHNQPLAEGEGNIKYENFFFLCSPLQIFFNLT